jgi:stage IV sporulation protein FB
MFTLRFKGKIPITIFSTFWIFAALIGYLNSQTLSGTFIWIGIILISVLFHECGHALTALMWGKKPRIELVALGGLTYHESEDLPLWKQFFIVLDGPIFGFILFLLATLLLSLSLFTSPVILAIIEAIQAVNLFWTLLNLLPVFPLDGGQLLRIVFEGMFGLKGLKYAFATSTAIGTLLSLGFFLFQWILVGALFFLLAYQSFEAYRRSGLIAQTDRNVDLKHTLAEAEKELQAGHKDLAMGLFEKIRTQAKEGMVFVLSTQYLAFLKYDQGNAKECYQMLLPLKKELSPDALCILHRAAFEEKDYSIVAKLSAEAFESDPSAETALRNACAFASLSKPEPAVGWLQTAHQEGLENVKEVVGESTFDSIRKSPLLKQFLSNL